MIVWLLLMGFLFGAVGGSLLNAIIYRLPIGLTLWNPPRSFCPNCRHSLGFKDLIPLFSYLAQGGRCRYCKTKISVQYFLVEILGAGLGTAAALKYLVLENHPLKFNFGLLFLLTLLAIFFIDIHYFVIPDSLNSLLFFIGMSQTIFLSQDLMKSFIGAWTGLGVIWAIALIGRVFLKKDAMGHGDLKMSRGIGAMLFASGALLSLTLAIFLGAAAGVVLIFRSKKKENIQEEYLSLNEEQEEPESILSLLKSGAGYALGMDLLGWIFPRLNQIWFGFSDQMIENKEDHIEWSKESCLESALAAGVIPFGPCLALGAVLVFFFEQNLNDLLDLYFAGIGQLF